MFDCWQLLSLTTLFPLCPRSGQVIRKPKFFLLWCQVGSSNYTWRNHHSGPTLWPPYKTQASLLSLLSQAIFRPACGPPQSLQEASLCNKHFHTLGGGACHQTQHLKQFFFLPRVHNSDLSNLKSTNLWACLSFHLLRSSLIFFNNVLQFSVYKSFISFIKFIPKYLNCLLL